ncbi:sacsin N-terminal ATP-binding-like domain-containing protein [Bacillus sp. FJAT-42315]|uniref:sacsin N-terminal ATP-binding-like domain-containing protein n=1 Tax=Bacillus sp. FJAT-42315 TaxID=2014077 RepID=UPI000C24811C|nr:ATP-binding protein [Bacillus sp. FJAT-42315]
MQNPAEFEAQLKKLKEHFFGASPGNEALGYLKTLREFESRVPGYMNSLKVLSDTTYEDRKHFLLELIQNADDATYDTQPTIHFKINNDYFAISYNESGFSMQDIFAITDTGGSTKTTSKLGANSFIGEKGIGFKSVFALAKEVHIHSGPWHFKLDNESYIVPTILENESFTEGTELKVYFKESDSIEIIADELRKLLSERLESFLFLQQLSHFILSDYRSEERKIHTLNIEKSSDLIKLTAEPVGIERQYLVYEDELEFSPDLVKSRWERLTADQPLKRTLKMAVLLNSYNLGIEEGRLFCYLPTEVTLPIPIFLQVDGHLKADRERLHDPQANEWNRYLLEYLPIFLKNAYLQLRNNSSLENSFPDLIPVQKGNSQLASVFERFIELLKEMEWVKTSSGWKRPNQIVLPTSLWSEMLKKDDSLQAHAEKRIYMSFIFEDWQQISRWESVWKEYQIKEININQIVTTLERKQLQREILEDDSLLTQLYESLYKGIKPYYSWKNLKERIKNALIFPIENHGFRAFFQLKNASKVYWLSNRMRKNHGLQFINDLSIIDYSYTMQPTSLDDPEQQLIAKRNEALRMLLKEIKIEELNEDTILRSIQIPYLTKQYEKWTKKIVDNRMQVLFTVFDAYRAKRSNKDESYLKVLSKLREMKVLVANKKIKKLSNVILPIKLQLKNGDDAYNNSGLSEIELPEDWYLSELKIEQSGERMVQYYKEIRDFLVACGIANSPQFFFKDMKYDTADDFKDSSAKQFAVWQEKNRRDYTRRNSITLQNVVLDQATRDLFKNEKATVEVEQRLYQVWRNNYLNHLGNIESSSYYESTPPGFIKTIYHRQRSEKELLIEDDLWGGLDRYFIPLTTEDERLTNASKALRLKSVRGLNKVLNFWDIVHESTTKYNTFYLDTLKVKDISIKEINEAWRIATPEQWDDLLGATYELANNQIDLTELRIVDKNTRQLRSIFDFKLGAEINEITPYIEQQYGAVGRSIGEKLQLQMDSEIIPLLESLEEFYLDEQQSIEEKNQIINYVIKQFEYLNKEDQLALLSEQLNIKKRQKNPQQLHYVCNNFNLYQYILEKDYHIVHVECDVQKEVIYNNIASEFSMKNVEEYGKVSADDYSLLAEDEKSILIQLFKLQFEELEFNELSRLKRLFDLYGGIEQVVENIVYTNKIYKKIFDFEINSSLPLYDIRENRFYVQEGLHIFEIAAQWIAFLEFSPYKSTLRDYEYYYQEIIEREQALKKPNKSTATLKDSSGAIEELDSGVEESIVIQEQQSKETAVPKENNKKGSSEVVKAVVKEPLDELNTEENLQSVADLLINALQREQNNEVAATYEPWKTATDPEQHLASVAILKERTTEQLKIGPVQKEVRERAKKIKSNIRYVDTTAPDPKKYLIQEYGGRCQVCATRLIIGPNQYYIEVYRLIECKEGHAWHNQPFNILGLCPNCHALMKHGQQLDLISILEEAKAFLLQETAPQEMELYNGDFYDIPCEINGEEGSIVFSQQHLNHFAMFISLDEE